MLRPVWVIVALLLLEPISVPIGLADDALDSPASAFHAVNDFEWSQMTVRILGPDQKPVTAAVAHPVGFHAGRAAIHWNAENYGTAGKSTSDQSGHAQVIFPKFAKLENNPPVFAVRLIISNSQFCEKRAIISVPFDPAAFVPDVTLEEGFRLRIAGVLPGHEQPLPDCYVLLEAEEETGKDFIRQPDHWLQSVLVHESRRWYQVVWLPADKPPQFGRRQAWEPEDPASRDVRVEVRPGVRVIGKLSDNVKRPIERGRVAVICASKPSPPKEGGHRSNDSTWWRESVPIARDGTFEFPSLPPGYIAQFRAFANDCVSAQPTAEEYQSCSEWFGSEKEMRPDLTRYPQVHRLAGQEVEVTIEMEPGGQLRVHCVDPAGHPLKGIRVSAPPNQYIVPKMTTSLSNSTCTVDQLRNPDFDTWSYRDDAFSTKTNENGDALIRGVPVGKSALFAEGDGWKKEVKLQINDRVAIEAGQTTDVQVTLQPLP